MATPDNLIRFPAAAVRQRPTADPLDEAEARVRSAHARAGDEAIDRLDWLDRDTICRDLAEALRLIREAREGDPPAAS